MLKLVSDKRDDLRKACAKRGVRRLELFGSATGNSFEPGASDLDFLVDFPPLDPVRHADSFFGLQEDLENLFGRPVDLVEPSAVRNPFFLEAIQATRMLLYAAS